MTKDTLIGTGVNFERVRRITGYLSRTERFNDAKRDELNHRVKHSLTGVRCPSCDTEQVA